MLGFFFFLCHIFIAGCGEARGNCNEPSRKIERASERKRQTDCLQKTASGRRWQKEKGFFYSFLLARSRQPTLPLLFGRSMFRLTRSSDYLNKYIFHHQKREEEEEYIDVCVQLQNAAATPLIYSSDSFLFKYKSKLYGVCVCVCVQGRRKTTRECSTMQTISQFNREEPSHQLCDGVCGGSRKERERERLRTERMVKRGCGRGGGCYRLVRIIIPRIRFSSRSSFDLYTDP